MSITFETCSPLGKFLFVASVGSLLAFVVSAWLASNLENENYNPPKSVMKRILLVVGGLYAIHPKEALNEEGRMWQRIQVVAFVSAVISFGALFGLSRFGYACGSN